MGFVELIRTHVVLAIRPSNSFAKSNHALQLSYGDPVRVLTWATAIILPQGTVFVDENS
jgi:hypothetical protein